MDIENLEGWASNPDVCRCCLSTSGQFDMTASYLSENGIKETYSDMLQESFGITLSCLTDWGPSRFICSLCIGHLRDAYSFRKQVLQAEKNFVTNCNKIEGSEKVQIKCETKLDGSESCQDVPSNQVSDEDKTDVDNKVSSNKKRTPKETVRKRRKIVKLKRGGRKEDSDSDTPIARLSKKNAPSAKDVNAHNSMDDENKSRSTIEKESSKDLYGVKAKLVSNEHNSLSKRVFLTEKMAHIKNASTLLEFSNAIPFRSTSRTAGFPCFYCHVLFENSEKLRAHQLSEHEKTEIKHILGALAAECLIVYVDVTDLKCTICDQNIPSLNELKNHLTKIHKKRMHSEYTDRVIPFKLPQKWNDVYECLLCGFRFETFGSIERHMNVHYRNYVCKECGTGFMTRNRLKVHTKCMHLGGNFPCELCQKVYSTPQKYKNHVDTVHKQMKRFKCTKCPERFSEYLRRQKHLVEIHGVAPLLYKCNVCDKAFDRRDSLSRHMKRDHLEERNFQCEVCTYKCFTANELRMHMIKHNGEKIYECTICKKSYARKKTLTEHLRIHNNDRRFSCPVCGQAFVQKCSLKGHMKTHHVEYSLQ